jgi:hypothetical protein
MRFQAKHIITQVRDRMAGIINVFGIEIADVVH